MNPFENGPDGPDRADDDLRALVRDAVADVEPTDRLAAIRARTTPPQRRGWWAAGGSALLAAAVVVAVAVVVDRGDGDDPDVAAPTPSSTATPSAPPTAGLETADDATTPVYYVGDGPESDVLYRYFEPEGDPIDLLMEKPSDPDYRTLWPEGSLTGWDRSGGGIVVQAAVAPDSVDPLALQQLVYTMQAVTGGRPEVTVQAPTGTTAVERRPVLDVLSHVSISNPGEDFAYAGSFVASGVANGFEGNVACAIVDAGGTEVWSEPTIAGFGDDRLYRWSLGVDLTGIPEGTYTFTCSTEEPTGGPTHTDTRAIRVEAGGATTPDPGAQPTSPGSAGATAYFVGPGPDGPDAPAEVLYRSTSTDPTPLGALMAGPTDPDYETRWPPGSLVSYDVRDDVVRVVVDGGPVDDAVAVQQLVLTLQAAEDTDLPVELVDAGGDRVVAPTPAESELDIQSHLQIHAPDEGAVVSGAFVASGVGNSFEGTIFCQLLDAAGDAAWEKATVNGGLLDDTLKPWETRVNLSRVEPGDHTLRCITDDPTAGTEGRGTDVDTRTITVE